MTQVQCPVCNTRAEQVPGKGYDPRYLCERCGAFVMTSKAAGILGGSRHPPQGLRWMASHKIRLSQRDDRLLRVDAEMLGTWADQRLPNANELCTNFLFWVAGASPLPGTEARGKASVIRAIIGAADEPDGLSYAEQVAQKKGWIRRLGDTDGLYCCQMSIDGWAEFERLQEKRLISRHGFMAMAFSKLDVEQAFKEAFVPAVLRTGFELRLVTHNQPAGLIDDQLRVAIRTARFVVADLTYDNRGAYWEAGFAEGLGRPVFYTCEKAHFEDKKKGTHFDTNHMNTVVWSLDDLPDAERRLTAMIRATLPDEATMEDA